MNKRTVAMVAVILTAFGIIFLTQPTNYTITVYNSRYYENCRSFTSTNSEQQCVEINPPEVIEKQEPFIVAWWNKMQIERTYTLDEAMVQ